MDSASQSDIPPGASPSPFSHLLGIVIAILTLTLPVFAIAHFSSAKVVTDTPSPYRFSQTDLR
jgi:hypothetical protein